MAKEMLDVAVSGILGDEWAAAFLSLYFGASAPLDARLIIDNYATERARLQDFVSRKRLDVVSTSLENLKRRLERQANYDEVVDDPIKRKNVETFFSDLPADLRRATSAWLEDRDFDDLKVRRKRRSKR